MKLLIKNILILNIKKLILYSRIYKFIPIYLLVFFDIFPRDLFGLFLSYKKIMKKNNLYNFENIIDIGSNSGNWTILFKFLYRKSNFFLIEADKKHSSRIRMISKDYHIGVLDKSISSKKFYIYDSYNGTGSSLFKEKSDYDFTIKKMKTSTLDKIIYKKFNKKKYDLIKLDTQGSELNILKGGIKTLKKTKYLITEIHFKNYNIGSASHKELNSFLENNGFKKIDILFNHYMKNKLFFSDVLYKNMREV